MQVVAKALLAAPTTPFHRIGQSTRKHTAVAVDSYFYGQSACQNVYRPTN